MANLSGSLSQLGTVVMLTEAATQAAQLITAYGKDIPITAAYASEWDLYKEYAECYVGTNQDLLNTLNSTIKELIAKPDPTEQDRQTLKSFFANMGQSDFDFSKVYGDAGWTRYVKWKTNNYHPFLAEGTMVYGFPNNINDDPRRTGRFIVFNAAGDSGILTWLYQNAHKYGFAWYGPLETAFMYVGTSQTFGETSQKAAALGTSMNLYRFIAANTGTAPTTQQDVTNFVNGIDANGYNAGGKTYKKDSFNWIAWTVVMDEV